MKSSIPTVLALLAPLVPVCPLLAQTHSIPWHSIGPGGTSTGGAYALSGSVGQWGAGKMSGGNLSLNGGFWAFASAQVGGSAYYAITDLGTLGGTGADGNPGAEPRNLNNLGQIVGYSYLAGNASYHSVFWMNSASEPLDLSTLGGATSQAWAISDLGQVVAEADLADGSTHAAIWASSSPKPQDLGSLGGNSSAVTVNSSGQIAGYSYTAGNTVQRAVYWPNTNSLPLDMGTLGGSNSEALWINESGQIVGDANPAGSELVHAAFWTNGRSAAVDLGTLGNQQSTAVAINAAGQIVGVTAANSFFETQAVYWKNNSSSPVNLDTPGGEHSAAVDINGVGQIVGYSYAGSFDLGSPSLRAVIWTNSSSPAIDLNTLIPANSGWVLQSASAINDSGEIIGVGTFGGQTRGFALNLVSAGSCAPPAGIVSWWRAENNAQDSIGANQGTLVNGAAFAAGNVGQAFTLDGTSQSVDIPDAPSLHPASVTLEVWMMFNGGSNYRSLLAKPLGSTTYDSYGIYLYNGTIVGFIGDGTPNQPNLSVALSPQPGRWYHVAYAFDDQSKQQALYLDGTQVAVGIANTSIAYDDHPVLLGRDIKYGSPALFFPGRLDEASIYNRALSAAEIASLYHAGHAGKSSVGPYFSIPPALPYGIVDKTYTQPIATDRGASPVSFALMSGLLPPGLRLTSAGLLSGTPIAEGSFNFTLRATDNSGLSVDQGFTLQVFTRALPPPEGIVSWWRAENNAQDSIRTNHGTLVNGATFAAGNVGEAFSLDGVSQSVEIPDAPSLRPASITLEAWMTFNGGSGYRALISKPLGSSTFDSYGIYLYNGTLVGFIGDGTPNQPNLSVPLFPEPARWYHVAYTFDDASKQQALYLDGTQVANGTANTAIAFDNHPVLLGRDTKYGRPDLFFPGRIDEAAIYDRALGPTEIASLYQAGPAGKSSVGPYFSTPPALPPGILNQAYTQPITAVRGTSPVGFAVMTGVLPPGLTLAAAGLLSGTPGAEGSFNFTVRATDNNGLSADQAFTIQVRQPPLVFTSVARSGLDLQLGIASQVGRTYNVLSISDFNTGFWSNNITGILGNGAIIQVTIPHTFDQPRQFFIIQQAP